jgi:hypothetical protein
MNRAWHRQRWIRHCADRAWQAVAFAVAAAGPGCSAILPDTEARTCDSALDCYAAAADDPFACWHCDRAQANGTCVRDGAVAPQRTLDLAGPPIDHVRAFTAAGKLTVVAEQEPAPGRGVSRSVALRLTEDLTREALPILDTDVIVSQLAVADAGDDAWCLGVDHRQNSRGRLCLGRCDETECRPVCDACSQPRRPTLAVQPCTTAGTCEKLLAYRSLDDWRVHARWLDTGGDSREVSLPATLDADCAPVVVAVRRAEQSQLVLVAAESGTASPWLALSTAQSAEVVVAATAESQADTQVHAVAAAAAGGNDPQGELLLAWIWSTGAERRLSVARTAWLGGDKLAAAQLLYEHTLQGDGSVSVAYAQYGLGARPGGWVVAFRDAGAVFALRIDRSGPRSPLRAVRLADAEADDIVVAAHPSGETGSSPFVFIARTAARARVHACRL